MKPLHQKYFWAALITLLLTGLEGVASRMTVPFNQAFEGAELVVQGDVIETWNPFEKDSKKLISGPRCYRMKVETCFKGGLEPGAEVLFWDRHSGSTASYGIHNKGQYICYLQPAELSDYEARVVNPDSVLFYRPMRVRSNRASYMGSTGHENYAREGRLLDLFVVNPPADKRAVYRQLLENESDTVFLSYVVSDWPRPCTDEDIILFKDKVLSSEGTGSYERKMLGEILKRPGALTDSDVAALLRKGGADYFSSLKPLITDRNIEDTRTLLFDFIQDAGAGSAYRQMIETLADLAPDYFKEQLVASHDFPLWKLLPCLKALGLNGSDLGLADFPEEVFFVCHNTLLSITKILEGDLFWIAFPLTHPSHCEDMKAALPLLEPVLKEKNSPVRRACVALFRTYGVSVERTGESYIPHYANAPAPCPVKLESRMERSSFKLGEEVSFFLKEAATVDGGDFSFEGKTLATLYFVGHWSSPEFLGQQVWNEVSPPRDAFVILEKGRSREREVKQFREIDRPGTYRLKVAKCYPYDGGTHGLDAWTGMVFAENELEFTVEEPDQTTRDVLEN